MSRAISSGALRRRVAIEQPADLDDGAGGVIRGYAPLAEVSAAVEPLRARKAPAGRALGLKRLWRVDDPRARRPHGRRLA